MKTPLQDLAVAVNGRRPDNGNAAPWLNLEKSTVEVFLGDRDSIENMKGAKKSAELALFYRGAVLRLNFKLVFNEPLPEGCSVAIFSSHSTDQPFNLAEKESVLKKGLRLMRQFIAPGINSRFNVLSGVISALAPAWLRKTQFEKALSMKAGTNLKDLPLIGSPEERKISLEARSLDLSLETDSNLTEFGAGERVFRKATSYVLTENSLQSLRASKVPKEILEPLEYLLDQVYRGEENFLKAIRMVLKSGSTTDADIENWMNQHQDKILRCAEKSYDKALYEKFFIEKDKPLYHLAMNLNSSAFNPAFPENEAIWISLKSPRGECTALGLRLPPECLENMVYLITQPSVLEIAPDDLAETDTLEQTIEFFRSDRSALRIAPDPRRRMPSFLTIAAIHDGAVSLKCDLKAIRNSPDYSDVGPLVVLSFIDQLSNKRLNALFPLLLRSSRQKPERRDLKR